MRGLVILVCLVLVGTVVARRHLYAIDTQWVCDLLDGRTTAEPIETLWKQPLVDKVLAALEHVHWQRTLCFTLGPGCIATNGGVSCYFDDTMRVKPYTIAPSVTTLPVNLPQAPPVSCPSRLFFWWTHAEMREHWRRFPHSDKEDDTREDAEPPRLY